MTLEAPERNDHEASSMLEAFKGDLSAPFEVVGKNEEPPNYPYIFLNKLKASWSNVCDLMDWKKEQQSAGWNFFRVSKDPFGVVTSIQEKILAKGGRLPSHGIDGRFGTETQNALNDVMRKTALAATSETVDLRPVEQGGPSHAMARIDERLDAAGLGIDSDWLKNPNFSETDVIAFQIRAIEFREQLVEKEPRLGPWNVFFREVIDEFAAHIKKIDLTKINGVEDMMRAIGEMKEPMIEAIIERMKDIFGDEAKAMEELRGGIDSEGFMLIFMASCREITVLGFGYYLQKK